MLTNGTLLRIDVPGLEAGDGSYPLVEGTSMSLRVAVDQPKTGQKWILGAVVKEATAVMYVRSTASLGIVPKGRVLVAKDTEAAGVLYTVLHVIDQVNKGTSHLEVYLRAN